MLKMPSHRHNTICIDSKSNTFSQYNWNFYFLLFNAICLTTNDLKVNSSNISPNTIHQPHWEKEQNKLHYMLFQKIPFYDISS